MSLSGESVLQVPTKCSTTTSIAIFTSPNTTDTVCGFRSACIPTALVALRAARLRHGPTTTAPTTHMMRAFATAWPAVATRSKATRRHPGGTARGEVGPAGPAASSVEPLVELVGAVPPRDSRPAGVARAHRCRCAQRSLLCERCRGRAPANRAQSALWCFCSWRGHSLVSPHHVDQQTHLCQVSIEEFWSPEARRPPRNSRRAKTLERRQQIAQSNG